MKVEIYVGLGTQSSVIWSGMLDCLPRTGEQIVLGKNGYVVEYIHHYLPSLKRKGAGSGQIVKLYVR
jgi:hypothetical protein